jgi:hypothetical protein
MSWLDRPNTQVQDSAGALFPPTDVTQVTGAGAPTVTSDPVNKKTVLNFPDATIVTKTIDAGSAPITQGYGIMQKSGKITLASIGSLSLGLYIAGLAIEAGTAGASKSIITQGLVDPTIVNVGAGVACAVGLDTNGKPVRVTDPTCVSGRKYVGMCDANGAIYVLPRTTTHHELLEYGAKLDGVADDATAISAMLGASSTTGLPSLLSPGTAALASTIHSTSGNVTIRGVGREQSTIKALTASMTMVSVDSGAPATLTFEDLTLDGNNLGFLLVSANGGFISEMIFRRVRFIGIASANAILAQWGNRLLLEDCIFEGKAEQLATGVNIAGGFRNIKIIRCRTRGVNAGIVLAPGTTDIALEDVTIEDCDFDLMYYTAPALQSGSGGTVSYTSTSLTDSSRTFTLAAAGTPGVFAQFGYIRALTPRATGTLQFKQQNQVIDSGASFLSDGIIAGELVRCGTAFAIVVSVDSDTTLNVEEWLDQTTCLPTTPPAATTAYTVYGVLLGKASSLSGSNHTVNLYNEWADLNGAIATPGSGTLYETLATPNYPIEATAATRRLRIVGNRFKRSYTDAISPFGVESIIAHNEIVDCQDVGITVSSSDATRGYHLVHDNRIIRQGATGIYAKGRGIDIHDNVIKGCGTRIAGTTDHTTGSIVGGIGIDLADACKVHNNVIEGDSLPGSEAGIGVHSSTNIDVFDNIIKRVSFHDIVLTGSTTTGRIRHGTSDIFYGTLDGTPAGLILDVLTTTSPQGTLKAALGSRATDTVTGKVWFSMLGIGLGLSWCAPRFDKNQFVGVDGLMLFFDGRTGITQASNLVQSWIDQAQGIEADKVSNGPDYSASGGPNSIPKISGWSASKYVRSTVDALDATTPRTVFVVGKQATNAGIAIVHGRGGGSTAVIALGMVDISGTVYVYTDGVAVSESISPAPDLSAASIITYTWQIGSKVGVRINGVAQTISGGNVATGATSSSAGITLGYNEQSGSQPWNGELDLILEFDRILSAEEISRVEAALAAIAGITL